MSVITAHRKKPPSSPWGGARSDASKSGIRVRKRASSGVLEAAALVGDHTAGRRIMSRGDDLLREGKAQYAARTYAGAVEVMKASGDPDIVEAYLRLGHANRALGRQYAAVQSYLAALERNPRHVVTLRSLVTLHAQHGEWSFVERYERRLFRAQMTSPADLYDDLIASGDRWVEADDPERARTRYEIAQRRLPERPEAKARLELLAIESAPPPPTKRSVHLPAPRDPAKAPERERSRRGTGTYRIVNQRG